MNVNEEGRVRVGSGGGGGGAEEEMAGGGGCILDPDVLTYQSHYTLITDIPVSLHTDVLTLMYWYDSPISIHP